MGNYLLLTEDNKMREKSHTGQSVPLQDYYRFVYLILTAFVTVILLLVLIQYNSSRSMERLIRGNACLLKELKGSNRLGQAGRDIIRVESDIRAAIATGKTAYLLGVAEKIRRAEGVLDSLKTNTADKRSVTLLLRLKSLANQKLEANSALMGQYHRSGKMNNITLIANPHAKAVSSEINDLVREIYDNRKL